MFKYKQMTQQTERARQYFENKLAFTLGPVELKKIMNDEDILIIDVRSADKYEKGHIPNSISIPAEILEKNLHKLSRENINILYCYNQQCHLAAKCAHMLANNAYPVMELEGGFAQWKDSDYEITT